MTSHDTAAHAGPQSDALRHVSLAECEAGKLPARFRDGVARRVERVGVIGAGTMGAGIAMCFADAGLTVTLVETRGEALDRGLASLRKRYDRAAAKGRLTQDEADRRIALISGSLSIDDLGDADLVIEAVFENLDVKRDLFARLDRVARPGAVLATNTSFLDIKAIAAATARPQDVVGLHFFSPANVMKLLEIVYTPATSADVLATAAAVGKAIGKVGVHVGNGHGFVGNRMLAARGGEADRLLLEGASPQDIDRVLVDFGFAMGPFQTRDLVGLDVGWDARMSASGSVRDILNERGRHGQKTGSGYYDYGEGRRPMPSAVTDRIIADFAAGSGIAQRRIDAGEILDRLVFALVNEGAKILDEGIASRSSDIDVIWVHGYGWPRYRGGPMYWADRQGLSQVLDRLQALEAHGDVFAPAPLIRRLAAEGGTFASVSR
jgi:3-hydroxyacyl-CoA dehydrogenase